MKDMKQKFRMRWKYPPACSTHILNPYRGKRRSGKNFWFANRVLAAPSYERVDEAPIVLRVLVDRPKGIF